MGLRVLAVLVALVLLFMAFPKTEVTQQEREVTTTAEEPVEAKVEMPKQEREVIMVEQQPVAQQQQKAEVKKQEKKGMTEADIMGMYQLMNMIF